MVEDFNFKSPATSAEQSAVALCHFVSDEAKKTAIFTKEHRAGTGIALCSVALLTVFKGKAGKIEEAASELEAIEPKAAGEVAEETVAREPVADVNANHQVAFDDAARINKDTLRLTEGTGSGKSWRQIFTGSFPPEERDPVHAVVGRIKNDGSTLYETKGAIAETGKPFRDRTVAISIVEPIGTGSLGGVSKQYKLLSWHATRDGFRSEGIGGKQLEQILSKVRGAKDTAGIAVEIEHTGLKKLPDAAKIRSMIKAGKIDRHLVDPSVPISSEAQITALRIRNIYVNGYELEKSHQLIKQVLGTVGQ